MTGRQTIKKLGVILSVVSLFFAATSMAAPTVVTDIAGREVTVNVPVSRVMLADSRVL